jgi:hypothetical protein
MVSAAALVTLIFARRTRRPRPSLEIGVAAPLFVLRNLTSRLKHGVGNFHSNEMLKVSPDRSYYFCDFLIGGSHCHGLHLAGAVMPLASRRFRGETLRGGFERGAESGGKCALNHL